MAKTTAPKKKGKKMDPKLISKQLWELRYIRLHFYKWHGTEIIHPSLTDLVCLIVKHNHSRKEVYAELFNQEFIKL